jgi:hypothetical protein
MHIQLSTTEKHPILLVERRLMVWLAEKEAMRCTNAMWNNIRDAIATSSAAATFPSRF